MLYIDASALAKFVTQERESHSLRAYTLNRRPLISVSLTHTELLRHALRNSSATIENARELLKSVRVIDIDRQLLDHAATLQPPTLRTLDAIHIAAALLIRDDIEALVTYDRRMQEAASYHGIPSAAPS